MNIIKFKLLNARLKECFQNKSSKELGKDIESWDMDKMMLLVLNDKPASWWCCVTSTVRAIRGILPVPGAFVQKLMYYNISGVQTCLFHTHSPSLWSLYHEDHPAHKEEESSIFVQCQL